MHSKSIINILVLFAVVGLSAFVTIKLTSLDEKHASFEQSDELENLAVKNLKLQKESTILENNLINLKEKKAFLEGGISENEKFSGELDKIIQLLGERRVLLVSDIKMLELKKGALTSLVTELLEQEEKVKQLPSTEVVINSDEINNTNKLLLQLSDLRAETEDLKKQKKSLKSNFDIKVSDDWESLQIITTKLAQTRDSASREKALLEKEIKELLSKIQILITDNNKKLTLANNEKEQLIENYKLEKKALDAANKTNDDENNLKNLKLNFEKLNGLNVIFSGNMIYDEASRQIVFRADNSIGIPIFQDDFTGSIAGKCGLPIDKEIKNRCSATIIAEFVVVNSGLFLRGKEIVEIVRK